MGVNAQRDVLFSVVSGKSGPVLESFFDIRDIADENYLGVPGAHISPDPPAGPALRRLALVVLPERKGGYVRHGLELSDGLDEVFRRFFFYCSGGVSDVGVSQR